MRKQQFPKKSMCVWGRFCFQKGVRGQQAKRNRKSLEEEGALAWASKGGKHSYAQEEDRRATAVGMV